MNQVMEMNAFVNWLEINPLEPTTQTLWFHLMVIANKSGYPEWFTVANSLLQAKVGVTENTLIKHRNYLVQKGRIEYKSMGKQKAGKYRLSSFFTSNNEVNHAVNCAAKYEVNHEVKGSALLKDLSSINLSSSGTSEYESFYAAHERVFGFQCNPFQAKHLAMYIDEDGMDETVVIRAIERAGASSIKYNFNFIRRIVDDYFKSGIKTLDQAIASDTAYESRKLQIVSGDKIATKQPQSSRKSYAELAGGYDNE
jgi:DnaD/phage-associated family protein